MEVAIKICGLTRPEDAAAAEESGARFGGVILAPGGKRTISVERAADVLAARTLLRCGVFVDPDRDSVLRAADQLRLDVVQLHGDEPPEFSADLRETGLTVWKAVRPRSAAEFDEAVDRYEGTVDGLHLDGWSPLAPGGTGTSFPWEEIAPHRSRIAAPIRLIVAGGLTDGNVAGVISLLAPDVVDVSSGVEVSPGIKDIERMRAFATSVRGARVGGATA